MKTLPNTVIAERRLLFSPKDEPTNKKDLLIQINAPYHVEEGEASFNVGAEGLYHCIANIIGIEGSGYNSYGIDSLQALSFVVKGLKSVFKKLHNNYDFYYTSGEPCPDYEEYY